MTPGREPTADVEATQVVVLAGGLATRLAPLGDHTPKALRPVAGKAFLDLMLAPLVASGLRRFHFCLGVKGEEVRRHLARFERSLDVTCAIEPEPRGTAAALLHSLDFLDEEFLLVMGDTLFEFAYDQVLSVSPPPAGGVIVATSAYSGVAPNVLLSGRRVARYDKTGIDGGWTDTGVALLRRDALTGAGRVGIRGGDLSELFGALIRQEKLIAVRTDRAFCDIGTPARYHDLVARMDRPGATWSAR